MSFHINPSYNRIKHERFYLKNTCSLNLYDEHCTSIVYEQLTFYKKWMPFSERTLIKTKNVIKKLFCHILLPFTQNSFKLHQFEFPFENLQIQCASRMYKNTKAKKCNASVPGFASTWPARLNRFPPRQCEHR
jgi:hypothetical protein